jgi:hypothetical protein
MASVELLDKAIKTNDLSQVRAYGREDWRPYVDRAEPIFRVACGLGHLEMAQWMCDMFTIKLLARQQATQDACANGHLHILKWFLIGVSNANDHAARLFEVACLRVCR